MAEISKFERLLSLNVNDKVEQKQGLTYLSWSFAWAEFKKVYPSAKYEVMKNENGLPYFESNLGLMIYTRVTADEEMYEMWLPVMDATNKAMKSVPYEYNTRNGKRTVEGATMFDVNKTIMRCLVKNLAMFGLGLYIYAGEDLPVESENIKEERLNAMLDEALKKLPFCRGTKEVKDLFNSYKELQSNLTFKQEVTEKGIYEKEVEKAVAEISSANDDQVAEILASYEQYKQDDRVQQAIAEKI